ncbi:MAG: DUF4912 domain-containing protein [Treponema sp.]|uniref:DUF4912 domain-containing protein n=1 Tax=Treponema sp. TaxID=166 RepID=UPI0025E726D2|nr:DUF4912 domain-containing protein [Treponema sp.]MBQ9622434.1 DUF4912 domain-containing protein [Treponema sp.]MBR0099402.1 DUF4912 domain-containing protein [Treponema sp.]MBR0495233.1 DUF4912 domain-containing protein [Treponema sp.]
MENKFLTLSHLETLSSADLIALADDYGIDIPDELNRRFIIGELLEVGGELDRAPARSSSMNENAEIPEENWDLPDSFNSTEISVILQNPAWAYVYWDISSDGIKKISESSRFKQLVLRVAYFNQEEDVNPVEYYDIQVSLSDREQYVLLEAGKKYFRVDLVAFFNDGNYDSLTVSKKIPLPKTPAIFSKAFPGQEVEIPKILEVSGLKKLLKSHYEKYRQSFVE